jgi:hypothetical protein
MPAPTPTRHGGAAATQVAPARALRPVDLADRMLHRRAVEAVVWGMPAVNFDLMFQAMVREVKGGANEIVYWSRLPDWKNQTLTPNPDAIYVMPFWDVTDGPVVLEIPPANGGSITGSIDDCWQTALEDVGPAGVDRGKGGKYLIMPPGYAGKVPDGFIAMPSPNRQGYALLRSILKSGSDADVAAAVDYAKRVRFYPWSEAAPPPATIWRDAIDVVFDATIPYDLRFFRSLDRMVQTEPWLDRDRAMIDVLRSIGIKKGKTFDPDARTTEFLEDAVSEAHAWMRTQYEAVFEPPFDPSARWALPASPALAGALMTQFADPDAYPVDARGMAYSYAFFSAKHLGAGQYYLMTIKDKAGDWLSGAQSYRLSVPAHAPVKQYWSATVYDAATHALIRDVSHPSCSSQHPTLQTNPDGSVDVFFAPSPPAGKASNWVPTNPDGGFEVLFRLYGPLPAFFDKTWKLPDIERHTVH